MSLSSNIEKAKALLDGFEHPLLISNWVSDPTIISMSKGDIRIQIPFASQSLLDDLQQWVKSSGIEQELGCAVVVSTAIKPLTTICTNKVNGVKNIIAITSAKGGVGKSTTAANFALALSQMGAKTGLLDADIYGPSLPTMFGTNGQDLEVRDGKFMQPIFAQGLATHSIGYLVDEEEAAIWRGPMASKALNQLLNETDWPDLDYLVIDMPPGTGDIQLTLAQQIPVTAAIVVTTPQDMALADARKGIAMFNKVNVPVLGIVENMSFHICSNCGHHEDLFGTGGAAEVAEKWHIPLLGQIPLHRQIREDIDCGSPTVAVSPESEFSTLYRDVAEQAASRLYWSGEVEQERIAFKAL